MKAISRRLRRLEERLVPKDGLPDLAAILRERFRRRRMEQSGEPYVEATPDLTERGLNLAQILRMRRERRVKAGSQIGPQENRADEALG
jgi:hypothetical protein